MNYAKKAGSALLSAATLAAIALFLAFPARYAKSVGAGISLWAANVLPATLPFLFLTAIFTNLTLYRKFTKILSPVMGKVFKVSGDGGCAAFLSAISGYPVGARTVLDLKKSGRIGREELFRVACLATTSGPAFLVGAVGCGMMGSALYGWILYLSHLAGIYLVCFFLRFGAKPSALPPLSVRAGKIDLADVLANSVLSVLCVGAAIAVFYAFGQMIADIGSLLSIPPALSIALRGLLEMTTGCACVAASPSPLTLALSCFFVTFGGLCVLVQQAAFLGRAGVKLLPFAAVKLLQGAVAAGICFLLSLAVF